MGKVEVVSKDRPVERKLYDIGLGEFFTFSGILHVKLAHNNVPANTKNLATNTIATLGDNNNVVPVDVRIEWKYQA
jgi:hypothetical protein